MEEKRESAPSQVVYLHPSVSPDEELDIIDLGRTLWRRKWSIVGFTVLCTLASVLVTLFYLPVLYRSESVIQPAVGSESSIKLMSKIAPFISGLGLPSLSSDEEKSVLMVNFLSSRTLKESIIKDFNLLPRMYFRKWDSEKGVWLEDDPDDIPTATKAIQKEKIDDFYSVDQDTQSGLITISYLDQDPEFAAKVVKGVTKKLDRYLKYDYVTDAKRNLIFVEGELKRAVRELEYWERQVPNQKHPESEVLREREASLGVYAELRKQYELARIEEARELIAFKVLDKPLVPEKKAKPKRSIICGITAAASLTLVVFVVLLFQSIAVLKKRKREVSG